MLVALMLHLNEIEAKEGEVGDNTNPVWQMTSLNAKFWIIILFIALSLVAAYKIAADNIPDVQKDSILYAKFL